MTSDTEYGRALSGQALAVHVEPVARLDPTGFDPSREDQICPYALTDARALVWCDGYQAALRWMMEAMQ